MYGLVNQAIQRLVTDRFDAEVWSSVCERAEVTTCEFVAMEAYDDAVTYSLVAAASEVLDCPVEDLLEMFGQYWTEFIAQEGYGDFLALSGQSVEDFLNQLDDMHTRLALSFPELKPPSFRCESSATEPGVLHLEYHSQREGLAPMVVGLLTGLGNLFDQQLDVELERARDEDQPYDVFKITVKRKTPA